MKSSEGYKVFYFENLERGEVLLEYPICEGRNVIEPVAVIVEKKIMKNL